MPEFYDKLDAMADQGRFLCIGLDPDLSKAPDSTTQSGLKVYEQIELYMNDIVDATEDVAAAYKPNSAFYEQYGPPGLIALNNVITHIKRRAPKALLTLDGKRGDIGNTSTAYAIAHFDVEDADALTISPYLGEVASEPFWKRTEKGIFVLARTSNPGAQEFQDLPQTTTGLKKVLSSGDRIYSDEIIDHLVRCYDGGATFPLYAVVAARVSLSWNKNNNCGVVAGATYPEELAVVRRVVGDEVPILIPGVGAQGGLANVAAIQGSNANGRRFLINVSSSISGASSGEDYKEAAHAAALKEHLLIQQGLKEKTRAA